MDKAWKQFERRVAQFFGARGRTPLSGGNSGHTRSDTLHPKLFIECKQRKEYAIINLWDSAKRWAKKENKIPVVAISEKGRPGFWLLIHQDHLVDVSCERQIQAITDMAVKDWQ